MKTEFKLNRQKITQAELEEQAIMAKRERDVTLDTNMNNVKVTIIAIENQLNSIEIN